jgi:protocatechuate 3,4-dioxygenase beta subunit
MMHSASRRELLATFLAGAGMLGPALLRGARAQPAALRPTPACEGPSRPTRAQTEGPFFRPNSPLRNNLITANRPGERMTLAGHVVTRSCRPVAGALVELWHADARGEYDNSGFDLRGHVMTDERGRYWFETIVPGLYPGRTRHFHVKAQAPGRRVLTTQFYFPGEPGNARDGIFDRALVMRIERAADGRLGRFDIVLDMA